MVRDLFMHENKVAFADCKAAAAVSTGMGVVMNRAAGTFAVPAAETANDICVVHKERIATGVNAAYADLGDYNAAYTAVAANEFVPLYTYDYGEIFGTDQYDADLVAGDAGKRMSVGDDGKWAVATVTTVNSKYVFRGFYTENGHTLARIEVSDTCSANAAG